MSIDWDGLFKQADNGPGHKFRGTIDITVAEELGFGFFMRPCEVIVIKDTEGRVWLIYETHEDDGEYLGLVSRYNVRPGMELRLKVSNGETKVFCITPETSPSAVVS